MLTKKSNPLFLFILIGALLFGIDYLIDKPDKNVIRIDDSTVKHILLSYTAGKNVDSLDQKTINALLKNYVESEIYYREALAMGLDKDDPIVKNRLIQKYQFLNQEEGPANFTTEELHKYYKANQKKYTQIGLVSFKQLFFNFDKHTDAQQAATEMYQKIKKDTRLFAITKGDAWPVSMHDLIKADHLEVWKYFGKNFADSIFNKPQPGLYPPIKSGYGYHIVQVSEVIKNQPIPFDEVKDLVATDLRNEQIITNEKQQLALLKGAYRVEFNLSNYKSIVDTP